MSIDCEHPNHHENIERYSKEFDSVLEQHVHTPKYGKLCGVCAAVEAQHLMEEAEKVHSGIIKRNLKRSVV